MSPFNKLIISLHSFSRAFRILILCSVCAAMLAGQEPKRLPAAKPADCTSCHTGKSPLPKDHPATEGLTLKDCQRCHAKGSEQSLSGKLPLSHLHQLQGATCAQCHEDVNNPEPVAKSRCISCHDMEKVAAVTASVKPTNPHTSPHYGKKSDCNLCHHQHETSENYCAQCHKFDFKLP